MPVQRTFPVIPDVSRSVQNEFRQLRNMLYNTQDQLATAQAAAQSAVQNLNQKPATTSSAASSSSPSPSVQNITESVTNVTENVTSTTGGNPNVTQLIGVLAQAQRSFVPEYSSLPGISDPASQNGSLISVNGILYRFNGDSQPGEWQVQTAIQTLLNDTYVNWTLAKYDPANYPPGTQFRITDWTNVIYVVTVISSVNTWVYLNGTYSASLGSLPTTGFNGAALGANDTRLRFFEQTTYFHQMQWTGSGWARGSEDRDHSDTFAWFGTAPTDGGWHSCDGSVLTYLIYTGTTANRTLPNLGTAAYPKATAATYTPGLSTPTVPTFAGTPVTPTFSGTSSGAGVAVQSGAGTNVVGAPYTPSGTVSAITPAGTISLPADPVENFSLILYYRR